MDSCSGHPPPCVMSAVALGSECSGSGSASRAVQAAKDLKTFECSDCALCALCLRCYVRCAGSCRLVEVGGTFTNLVQYHDLMCFTSSKLFQSQPGAHEISLPASFTPRAVAWVVHPRTLCTECTQGLLWVYILPVSHVIMLPFTFLIQRTWKYICDSVVAAMA